MFRLVNKDAKFPPLYEHVERKLATVSDKGYDKVGDYVLRDGIDLIPQEGMQENICKCESNLIFACGQAKSGKSFYLFLKALQGIGVPNYTGRLINVRKLDSAKGTSMFRDASLCWGQFSNCQVTTGELQRRQPERVGGFHRVHQEAAGGIHSGRRNNCHRAVQDVRVHFLQEQGLIRDQPTIRGNFQP